MVKKKDCRNCVHSFIDEYDRYGIYDIYFCYVCSKKRDKFLGMDIDKPILCRCKSYKRRKSPRLGINKRFCRLSDSDLPF